MADKPERPKFKRRALGRSLSKRKLGKKDDEGEESGGEEAAADESSDDSAASAEPDDENDPTAPLPIATGPIPPAPTSAPPGAPQPSFDERMVKLRSGASWFTREFGAFLVGLGRSASSRGKEFGDNVVRPFSSALLEAVIALVLLAFTLLLGISLGRGLHPVLKTSADSTTPNTTAPPRGRGHPFPVASPTTRPSFKPLPERNKSEGAKQALTTFLEAINQGDHQSAYSQLSPGWQKELTFESFSKGYASARDLRYTIEEAVPLGSDRVQLEVILAVQEGANTRKYAGTYIALKTEDGWKLDSGSLR